MTLVVEFLFFLEHTPETDLRARVSTRMEEEIAFQLARLPPHKLLPFVHFVRRQAETSAWPEERAFLRQLPGYLGWGDVADPG